MPVFTFANGELANYKTLSFTFSDYKVESGSDGVRIGVYHTTDGGGSRWKQMGDSFYANGTKTIDLEAFAKESGVDLAKVTSICFGGSNGAGSVTLKPSEMYIAMGTSAIHDAGSEPRQQPQGLPTTFMAGSRSPTPRAWLSSAERNTSTSRHRASAQNGVCRRGNDAPPACTSQRGSGGSAASGQRPRLAPRAGGNKQKRIPRGESSLS